MAAFYDQDAGGLRRPPGSFGPLFEDFPPRQEEEREPTTQERFEAFHRENPTVYAELVRYARNLRRAGIEGPIGLARCYEVLRYDRNIVTGKDDFKLNNDFQSRYARLIMEREADLKGFFRIRALRTE